MAGMPIRRARREAAEHAAMLRLRGGVEPDFPEYFANVDPSPVRHPPIPPEPPRPPREPHRSAGPPGGAAPPLTAEEASLFVKLRRLSLEKTLAFMEMTIEDYHPNADKLRQKQIEIAQSVMSLTGRVDPSKLRSEQHDELDDMLAGLKKPENPV